MIAIVAAALLGLRLPLLHTPRPFVPLDSPQICLTEDEYRELHLHETGRCLLGLTHAPRGETSAPIGTCGVLCEATDAGSIEEEGLYIVQAVAFSRFRVSSSLDGFAPLPIAEVDPWTDAQPEDDAALRVTAMAERRAAANAVEKRCHLAYRSVVTLLGWSRSVASSAHLGQLPPTERKELFRAVERFAPPADGIVGDLPDECPVEHLFETDDMETEATPDEGATTKAAADGAVASVDATAASTVCGLERTFLHACVEPASSYDVGGGPTGRLDEAAMAEFRVQRSELYSFALCRLHDASPTEVQRVLEGRSTTARLLAAEDHLEATRSWLTNRLGIDERSSNPPPGRVQLQLPTVKAPPVRLAARQIASVQRRWWRRLCFALRPPSPRPGVPQHNGWDAMEAGII